MREGGKKRRTSRSGKESDRWRLKEGESKKRREGGNDGGRLRNIRGRGMRTDSWKE